MNQLLFGTWGEEVKNKGERGSIYSLQGGSPPLREPLGEQIHTSKNASKVRANLWFYQNMVQLVVLNQKNKRPACGSTKSMVNLWFCSEQSRGQLVVHKTNLFPYSPELGLIPWSTCGCQILLTT